MTDLYDELRLAKSASLQEIKNIIIKLRKDWERPELAQALPTEAARQLQLLNEAEKVFATDKSRTDYDADLAQSQAPEAKPDARADAEEQDEVLDAQHEAAAREAEMKRITDSIDRPGLLWQVLCINKEYNLALVITRDCVAQMPYHQPGDDTTWEHCTLRKWLNNEFYDSLPAHIKSRIEETINKNPDNPENDVPGGRETHDKVFLLSSEEAEFLFASDSARTTRYKRSVAWWWLRSVGNAALYAANVYTGGNINPRGDRVDYPSGGVRPVLWLNLNEG